VLATLLATKVNAGCETTRVALGVWLEPTKMPMAERSGLGRWRDVLTWLDAMPPMLTGAPASCPSAPAPAPAPAPASGYAKQTEFDNTPYRFNMTQNGRRMSADDFDAWLEANGYSVGRRVEPAEDPQ